MWEMTITKKTQVKKNNLSFLLFSSCLYSSIGLKKQSEHSGLQPDWSSLLLPRDIIRAINA